MCLSVCVLPPASEIPRPDVIAWGWGGDWVGGVRESFTLRPPGVPRTVDAMWSE